MAEYFHNMIKIFNRLGVAGAVLQISFDIFFFKHRKIAKGFPEYISTIVQVSSCSDNFVCSQFFVHTICLSHFFNKKKIQKKT